MNDRHCPLEAKPRRRWWMLCLRNLAMLLRRRLMLHQPNSASPIILPDELIVEIISWLPAKTLMKFRCVNKFFKTTISEPHFVQMHLKKSSGNLHVAQFRCPVLLHDQDASFVTLSIPDLLQKHITILHDSPSYELKDYVNRGQVAGSCNGLICFNFYSFHYHTYLLCFWNPAMRTVSVFRVTIDGWRCLKYSFGFDNLTGTYKVVAFYVEEKHGYNPKSVVKVFTLGDNSWRDIQCFPVLPLYWFETNMNNGVYLSGTINWLAIRNYFRSDYYSFDWLKGVTVEQYVIVSLDLSTESYTQMLLPRGFVEVPRHVQPTVVVLKNCLCFCHDFKRIHFVIWQMKNFGVQESWVQLFKISYQTFNSSNWGYCFEPLEFLPLYLSKNGHTIIFAGYKNAPAFVYN